MQILRVAIVFLGAVLASLATAQPNSSSAIVFDADLKADIRVLIDISGSMKQNDPNNLRRPALELLVQLFPEGSKAGVWTFGQWVNNLVPSQNVGQSWRTDALLQAKKINSVAMYTNIPLVLETAVSDIDRLDPSYDVQLILLTDGMVDVSKSAADNDRARERVINELLPKLRQAGVTIHTVALSNNADKELMERLAAETGGLAAVAETADDLARIFLRAFDAAVPTQQLPLEGNAFIVDSSIEEFTALLFRKADTASVQLIAPDGKRHSLDKHPSDVRWFRQGNYDLITVKNPMDGQWRIDAELEPDSRVTIVSYLNLKVSPLDKGGFTDDARTLLASLAEADTTIAKSEFLNLVDMSVDIQRRNDQQSWHVSLSAVDPIPESGVFQSPLTMINSAGVYDLTVNAIGKTFSRQRKQTIAVREPFDIRVSSSHDDQPSHTISLFARNPSIDFAHTTVVAVVTLLDGTVQSMPVTETAERRWKLTLDGSAQSGTYSVYFDFKGQLLDGQSFSKRSPTVQIEHHVDGSTPAVVAAPTPQLEAEPESAAEPALNHQSVAQPSAAADEDIDWGKTARYIGLGLGNLLLLGLGYWAYKAITGTATKSDVLAASDDTDDEDAGFEAPVLADIDTDTHSLADIPTDDVALDDETTALGEFSLSEELRFDESLEDESLAEELLELETMDSDALDADKMDELDFDMGDDEEIDTEEDAEENPMIDIDDIDDFLDLPDDAIDIDPSKGKDL